MIRLGLLKRGATAAAAQLRRTPPPQFFATAGGYPVQLVYDPNAATAAARWSTTYLTSTFRPAGTQIYVATTGSDTTGDGSSGNPYATLQKAHDVAVTGQRVMVAAGRYAPVAIIKSVSFEATTADTVYVGPFLKNSDVSSWGALASGRQTITLNGGGTMYVYGFIDLAETYPASLRSYPMVAQHCPTAATQVATRQSNGRPGVYVPKSAASVLGAASGRDLTNTFDTTLLAWRNYITGTDTLASQTPFSIAGGLTVYSYGIFWCGGKERTIGTSGNAATMIMEKGGALGQGSDNSYDGTGLINTDQVIKCFGTFVAKDAALIGSNIQTQDAVDFDSAGGIAGVTINCILGQGGGAAAGGDQAWTMHTPVLGSFHVGTTFFDNQTGIGSLPPILDGVFNCSSLPGYFNSAIVSATLLRLFNNNDDLHVSDFTQIVPNTGLQDVTIASNATGPCYLYDYDHSFGVAGRRSGTGQYVDYYNQADPTADAILAQIIVDPNYLYTDLGGTTKVTTSGQVVARIQDPNDAAQYWTIDSGTGATYVDDGTRKYLSFTTARYKLNGRLTPFGFCDMIWGTYSSQTANADPFGTKLSQAYAFAQLITSASNPTSAAPFIARPYPIYKVNKGASLTTKTTLSAAVRNSTPNVVTIESIDLSHSQWNLMMFGSNGSSSFDYVGRNYGLIIQRHTGNTTYFDANYAAMQAVTV